MAIKVQWMQGRHGLISIGWAVHFTFIYVTAILPIWPTQLFECVFRLYSNRIDWRFGSRACQPSLPSRRGRCLGTKTCLRRTKCWLTHRLTTASHWLYMDKSAFCPSQTSFGTKSSTHAGWNARLASTGSEPWINSKCTRHLGHPPPPRARCDWSGGFFSRFNRSIQQYVCYMWF